MSAAPVLLHGFGKLPLAGDFIHYRLDGDEARAFVGWLERGQALVEGIRRGGAEDLTGGPEEPRRFRFAFDPGNGRRLLFGVLRESHDRGALRRFPFALFGSVEASGFRERPSLMPLLFAPAWDRLDATMDSLVDVGGTDELFSRLDGAGITLQEAGPEASKEVDTILAKTPPAEFWSRLFGEERKARRVALFDILLQAILPFARKRLEEVPVALKLPLAGSSADVVVQSAFWVDLLAGMLRGARLAPNLFLRAPGGGGPPTSLHVFFQRADETNYAALLTRRYEADYVNDLTAPGLAPSGPRALGGTSLRQAEDEEGSLEALVKFRWIG